MFKKIKRLILLIILITLSISSIAYAGPLEAKNIPYGPKVEDLKDKEAIIKNLKDMKQIRANLSTIDINPSLTSDQLKSIDKNLNYYLTQFNVIKSNLENHKNLYKNSFSDLFFSEEISFVADSFIISIRQQQNLIRALESNREEAKKLFYSNYLVPAYYYITLGDQMLAYIDNYLVIS